MDRETILNKHRLMMIDSIVNLYNGNKTLQLDILTCKDSVREMADLGGDCPMYEVIARMNRIRKILGLPEDNS